MSTTPRPHSSRWSLPGLWMVGAALILATAACDEAESPLQPDLPVLEQSGVQGGWDLPLMGQGQLARAFPASPCAAPEHREFDFWVGDWNVVAVDDPDAHFGTNRVLSLLDGCLVQENWTASSGFRGLSLNAYDAETGEWHQDWVGQFLGGLIGRLRTSGGLEGSVMVLRGNREAFSGGTPFLTEDEWTWTPTPEGDVIQTGYGFAGAPFDLVFIDFEARYVRGAIDPAPSVPTTFCDPGRFGAVTRQADFLIGDWSVEGRPGEKLGSSTIETDLAGCLFVESFRSRGGLEAIAFTYWDAWTLDWHRIWVDSEGERLALRGGFEDGKLVLQGTEGTRSGDVEVRLTWSPDGADVLQSWEVSRDGGVTWRETATLAYRR